ncbi:GAF domain-containing protein [Deinococcus sp. YIM 134068]|uniref:GAF domain-containing protein n=1 Tax=Deinococcus lichenicola TaxID=3118910 RepID=UPI002F956DED
MPSQSGAEAPARSSQNDTAQNDGAQNDDAQNELTLSEHLQNVTEALAAAQTGEAVFRVVLTPALTALNAVAGAVLLVSQDGRWLELADKQGYAEDAQTLWQDGPLDGNVPAGDVLEKREPLFFEQEGDLVRVYPELEARMGGVAAVATAVLPMFLDDRPLGTIILDFREPHHFTREETRFLRTLASQCAVALGRVRLLAGLRESEARFRRLVEVSPVGVAAGDMSGGLILVNDAYLRLLGYTRAELEAGEIDWAALTPPEYREADERAFARALERGVSDPYEKEMWTKGGERLPLAVVLTRYEEGGRPLVVGHLQDRRAQRAAERGLRADKAELERQVAARTAELEAARRTAEVLARLGDALQDAASPEEVAGRSLEWLGPAVGATGMGMVRLEGESVQATAFWGDVPEPIRAFLTRPGLRLPDTPNLLKVARTRRALYFDDYHTTGSPVADFPALSGSAEPIVTPGGTLVGFVLAWRPVGTGAWHGEQRDLLRRAAGTLGLALERAEAASQLTARVRQAEEDARAREAFVAFTEAVGTETDVLALVRRAVEVVRANVEHVSVAYYELEDGELEGGLWRVRVWSEELAPEIVAQLREGVPGDAPNFAEAARSEAGVFVDGWDAGANHVASAASYGAVALVPVAARSRVRSLFTVGTREGRAWTEREKAVVRAVARSLGLALERASVTTHLEAQNAELEARTQALEGFADLTRTLSLRSEPLALIERALTVVLSLLPPGCALFYQKEGDRWQVAARVGDLGTPELQAVVEGGLPVGHTPSLDLPDRTREPLFQDVYDRARDVAPELVSHLRTVSTLPVVVNGGVFGIFNVMVFEERPWSAADRAMLETTVRSLGLAIEGALGVAQLAQRTRELERSNAELEQFAYVASHDLQAPIRAVTSFAGVIERKYGDLLDDRGRLYLRQIVDNGGYMKRLVDDLLTFSRVHTGRGDLLPTDAGDVFDAVARRFQAGGDAAGANLTRDELPLVLADAGQLDQLLHNLISNGLKYHREGVPPHVHVTAQHEGEFWRFAVSDNGLGIEAQYFERIFVIFQRLHGREEFEGTGIGLAVCKKIVERHGGRMWLESTPGEGSTFFFTLPEV